MIFKKVIPARVETYEIEFYPEADLGTWGRFKKVRLQMNLSYQKFGKCFCCGKPFKDEDKLCAISVSKKGNKFACTDCCKQYTGIK